MSKKLTRQDLDALFEECREEISRGEKCDAIDEIAKKKGWIDPVALALATDIANCLAGKNMEILSLEMEEEFKKMGLKKEERTKMVESLYGYYLIERKDDLKMGRYIRWMTTVSVEGGSEKGGLTNGSFLVDIQKKDGKRGWNLLFKNWKNQFHKITFVSGRVFQQLNRDEIMVMLLSSNL